MQGILRVGVCPMKRDYVGTILCAHQSPPESKNRVKPMPMKELAKSVFEHGKDVRSGASQDTHVFQNGDVRDRASLPGKRVQAGLKFLALPFLLGNVSGDLGQGTVFTYQGQLTNNDSAFRKIFRLPVLLAVFVVLNTHSIGRAQSTSPIISLRLDPFVMRTGSETCRLLVQVDPHVVSMRVPNNFILYRGTLNTNLQLFDNGTHGDAIAGDHFFAIDQISFDLANDP